MSHLMHKVSIDHPSSKFVSDPAPIIPFSSSSPGHASPRHFRLQLFHVARLKEEGRTHDRVRVSLPEISLEFRLFEIASLLHRIGPIRRTFRLPRIARYLLLLLPSAAPPCLDGHFQTHAGGRRRQIHEVMALRTLFRSFGSTIIRRAIRKNPLLSRETLRVSSIPLSRSMISLSVDESSGIGTMTMSSPPVNLITLPFMEAFVSTLDDAVKNPACKGLVLTSGLPRVFSAGLDILTMYKPDEEKARLFLYTFQWLWMDLYLSPIPTVAALNGAAPAGGTILACCCDYRVMDHNEKLRMGLNETLLGIVAPWWTVKIFVGIVGHREAERALALGKLYSPSEALAAGLVDETVEASVVAQTAEAELKRWIGINAEARFETKKLLREALVEELEEFNREKDVDLFIETISSPKAQKVMGMYLSQLKGKAKK